MPYHFGSLLLLTTMIAGPMLIDPAAPDAMRGEGMMHVPAGQEPETAEALAAPTPEVEATPVENDVAMALATPRPTEWMTKVRRCRRRGARRYCDGPRMVARPHGEAADRAEALGLGENSTASSLLWRAPEPEWIDAVGSESEAEGILFPVEEGRMGRGFGFVRRSSLRHVRHDGVDIPASAGSSVRAVDDGIVAYADNGVSGYGNLVLIVHGDGGTSLYAHLRASYLFAGQRVVRGQTIGEVGTTGLSRAPHLHFEYREGGHLTDPVPHFVDLPEQVGVELERRATRHHRAQQRRARRARAARRARRAERRAERRAAAMAHDHG
jgi:murein DD-endopeptidase MepM/ murein hydrolase activator NlpD